MQVVIHMIRQFTVAVVKRFIRSVINLLHFVTSLTCSLGWRCAVRLTCVFCLHALDPVPRHIILIVRSADQHAIPSFAVVSLFHNLEGHGRLLHVFLVIPRQKAWAIGDVTKSVKAIAALNAQAHHGSGTSFIARSSV